MKNETDMRVMVERLKALVRKNRVEVYHDANPDVATAYCMDTVMQEIRQVMRAYSDQRSPIGPIEAACNALEMEIEDLSR
jgi:hypothetical protein